jgi:hypothetical protein
MVTVNLVLGCSAAASSADDAGQHDLGRPVRVDAAIGGDDARVLARPDRLPPDRRIGTARRVAECRSLTLHARPHQLEQPASSASSEQRRRRSR